MLDIALVAVALAAVAFVLATAGESVGAASEPGAHRTQLSYRVVAPDPSSAGARVARVLRDRLASAGIAGATVSARGDRVVISAAAGARTRTAIAALTAPGHVAIYDWEPNVIGPLGVPAPADRRVTGGAEAARAGAVTRDEAVRRAAKRPRHRTVLLRADATPANRWYAVDDAAAMTDADIGSARADTDPVTRQPVIRMAPDGLDGAGESQIQGGLSAAGAARLAAILDAGRLPATLRALP